jgi:hypothetical protein
LDRDVTGIDNVSGVTGDSFEGVRELAQRDPRGDVA